MNTVPLSLVQAAADALLRFPDLPDKAREQLVGYIEGTLVQSKRCVFQELVGDDKFSFREKPWINLLDLTINTKPDAWAKQYFSDIQAQ